MRSTAVGTLLSTAFVSSRRFGVASALGTSWRAQLLCHHTVLELQRVHASRTACAHASPLHPLPPLALHGPPLALHEPPLALHGPPLALHGPPLALHGPPLALHGPPLALHGPPLALHGPPLALHCMGPLWHCMGPVGQTLLAKGRGGGRVQGRRPSTTPTVCTKEGQADGHAPKRDRQMGTVPSIFPSSCTGSVMGAP